MFRKLLRGLTVVAALTAVGLAPAVASAAPAASTEAPVAVVPARVAVPQLVDVNLQRGRGFDRLVLQFRGGTPDVQARLVRFVRDEDGRVVRLPGRVVLLLTLDPARARLFDDDDDFGFGGRNVLAVRVLDEDDDVVRVAVALRTRADFRVFELRNRVVVDVDRGRFF